MRESQTIPNRLWRRLNPGMIFKIISKYGLGTLLIVLAILGSQIFRMAPRTMLADGPSQPSESPTVPRHSTLNAEVYYEFVCRTTQRMYPRLSQEIVDSAIKYSEKYNLSPVLVLAIIKTESEFYPFASSKQNARGLMQISPEANQQLLIQQGIFKEPADIYDPDRNIEAGCFLLRRFINESADFSTALDKYLGADSVAYKAQIHEVMGKILLLGITEELNRTAHKIEPLVKLGPLANRKPG